MCGYCEFNCDMWQRTFVLFVCVVPGTGLERVNCTFQSIIDCSFYNMSVIQRQQRQFNAVKNGFCQVCVFVCNAELIKISPFNAANRKRILLVLLMKKLVLQWHNRDDIAINWTKATTILIVINFHQKRQHYRYWT